LTKVVSTENQPFDLDEHLAEELGQRADAPAAARTRIKHLGARGIADHRVRARSGLDKIAAPQVEAGVAVLADAVARDRNPARLAALYCAVAVGDDAVEARDVGGGARRRWRRRRWRRGARDDRWQQQRCRDEPCRHAPESGLGRNRSHAGVLLQLRFRQPCGRAEARRRHTVRRSADEWRDTRRTAAAIQTIAIVASTATRVARERSRIRCPTTPPSSARPVMSAHSAIGSTRTIATSRAIASAWAVKSSTPQRSSAGHGSGWRVAAGQQRSDDDDAILQQRECVGIATDNALVPDPLRRRLHRGQ
jgi:hypothetical protein